MVEKVNEKKIYWTHRKYIDEEPVCKQSIDVLFAHRPFIWEIQTHTFHLMKRDAKNRERNNRNPHWIREKNE